LSADIRPIIARTICATGQETISHTVYLATPEEADSALGARITAVEVSGKADGSRVMVSIEFDVHAWYSFDKGRQSGIVTEHVRHEEELAVSRLPGIERLGGDEQTYVSVTRPPEVVDRFIRSSGAPAVGVTVSLGLGVNIFGESKLWVRAYPPPGPIDEEQELPGEAAPESFAFLEERDDIELPEESF